VAVFFVRMVVLLLRTVRFVPGMVMVALRAAFRGA
jgi:hypothetical protein